MTLAIANIVSRIVTLLIPGRSASPSGANAVRTAHSELEDLAEKEFEAVLEEPDIVEDAEAEFFGDPKVEVRLRETPFDAPQRLVFDLDDPQFEALLEAFDLDMDSMEELAGEAVPVQFVRGNPVVDWPSILAEKRAEERRQAREEMAEEAPEEVVTEDDAPDEQEADEVAVEDAEHQPSDGLDVGAEADESDDGDEDESSAVNVEETTVSASSDESSNEVATDGGETTDG